VSHGDLAPATKRFRADYAVHRASEGRGHDASELAALPYLSTGPLARQWQIRARSFDALVRTVLRPAQASRQAPLSILDLGAGCGWLCNRAALAGHRSIALDVRDDSVDGLGAAAHYLQREPGLFGRVAASFDALPLASGQFDVAVFNASIHYALDLSSVIQEAVRVVRSGGRIVILDSPFYANEQSGAQMVAEKHRNAVAHFGERAQTLLALPFVEFLTPERLASASSAGGLVWRRHRVRYTLWYEARPAIAWLRGRRPPSRFDLWECAVP
jgi:SAM-dependent methyltransferase